MSDVTSQQGPSLSAEATDAVQTPPVPPQSQEAVSETGAQSPAPFIQSPAVSTADEDLRELFKEYKPLISVKSTRNPIFNYLAWIVAAWIVSIAILFSGYLLITHSSGLATLISGQKQESAIPSDPSKQLNARIDSISRSKIENGNSKPAGIARNDSNSLSYTESAHLIMQVSDRITPLVILLTIFIASYKIIFFLARKSIEFDEDSRSHAFAGMLFLAVVRKGGHIDPAAIKSLLAKNHDTSSDELLPPEKAIDKLFELAKLAISKAKGS